MEGISDAPLSRLAADFPPVPLLESADLTTGHAERLQYESLELFDVPMSKLKLRHQPALTPLPQEGPGLGLSLNRRRSGRF